MKYRNDNEHLFCDRSPSKLKKHSKPSFKFSKREKFYKPKEKVNMYPSYVFIILLAVSTVIANLFQALPMH